ncbi:MAG TPA: SWIB/MDM2 domain-containing protein [Longimicrobiales bacterium]|nr:SWIB/MDM2 domain-containing protein [Longimicrobiales bacterium]
MAEGKKSTGRGGTTKAASAGRGAASGRGGTAAKGAAKKAGGAKAPRQARGGITQPVQPDAQLAPIVGSSALPRSELTKKVWDYVKKNNLQDSKNRRMINADSKLRPIFGKDQVSMFEMTKLVNQHVK